MTFGPKGVLDRLETSCNQHFSWASVLNFGGVVLNFGGVVFFCHWGGDIFIRFFESPNYPNFTFPETPTLEATNGWLEEYVPSGIRSFP